MYNFTRSFALKKPLTGKNVETSNDSIKWLHVEHLMVIFFYSSFHQIALSAGYGCCKI